MSLPLNGHRVPGLKSAVKQQGFKALELMTPNSLKMGYTTMWLLRRGTACSHWLTLEFLRVRRLAAAPTININRS